MALIISIGMAYVLVSLSMPGLDLFFLDWRQILLNGRPPEAPFLVMNASQLKDTANNSSFSEKTLLAIIDDLSRAKPKLIVLAISPAEIATNNQNSFARKLSTYSNLYLYSDFLKRAKNSFFNVENYKSFPRLISFFIPYDSTYDQVSRRIMLYYDLDKKHPGPDFHDLPIELDVPFKSPEDFKGTFNYMDSVQVYMKIWQTHRLDHISPNNFLELGKMVEKSKDKIVIIGTLDTYALLSSPSINRRKDIFGEPSIKNSYWSDADLIATYLINMYSGDHIAKASSLQNGVWLFLWIFAVISALLFLEPSWGIVLSFCVICFYLVLNFIIFRTFSVDYDLGRGLLGSVFIQYIGIPILLMRHLRRVDAEKVRIDKQREADRIKSRFIVKAARADLSLQIAARVSHDIRSPLMALQVAQSVVKGKVSEDLELLIGESVSRIKFIADDILESYRKGKAIPGKAERISLFEVVQDLIKTYKELYPSTQFEIEIDKGLHTYIPAYSLQRCLSSLFNNSIEAMEPVGRGKIVISARTNQEQIEILVVDNGKGVPADFIERLFGERATYGKSSGTGLGLYQVRKELEIYGGRIEFKPQEIGSCFIIRLPNSLSRIPISVSSDILIVEATGDIQAALLDAELSKLNVVCCSSIAGALRALRQDHEKKWTIFVDMALSEEESGFDLIEALANQFSGRIILCSAFTDNLEVQNMAERYNAILFNKDLLPRVSLEKK